MGINVISKDWPLWKVLDGKWKTEGQCLNFPIEMFFELFEKGNALERREVLKTCEGCPVREPCVLYAKATKSSGVFGGEYFFVGKQVKNPLRSSLTSH